MSEEQGLERIVQVEPKWSLEPRITRHEGEDGEGFWEIRFTLPTRGKTYRWIAKRANTPLELTTILEAVGSLRLALGREETTEEALARGLQINHCPTRWAAGGTQAPAQAHDKPRQVKAKLQSGANITLEELFGSIDLNL